MSGRGAGGQGDAGAASPRSLNVEWQPGRRVTARLEAPAGEGKAGILLAPGAGAGQSHPFPAGLRRRLAAAGHPTMTFDYPYAAEGRRAPDRLAILLACHRAAARELTARVGAVVSPASPWAAGWPPTLPAGGEPCSAVVCYGYPLLPPSRESPRDTAHLNAVTVPLLFLAGSRDHLAPLDLLRPVVEALTQATLHILEGGDHSFGVKDPPGE